MKPLSRRKFISAAATTAATTCLPLTGAGLLAADSAVAAAAPDSESDSRESATPAPLLVVNRGYKLMIDPGKGTIASFQSTYGADRELLIPGHAGLPLFKIEFMNAKGEFGTSTSSDAKEISVKRSANEQEERIEFEFKQIG